jgi:UDP-N-acetylmuramyl pentapeptide phosphotransferase/UDP-N-acetylglucosamine-1-phosphate transferase
VSDSACVVVSAGLAFALSGWLAAQLAQGRWVTALDHPNERSLHASPTPRTGGLAIFIAVALAQMPIILLHGVSWDGLAISVAVVGVLLISIVDDLRNVAVIWRLGVHVGAAIVLLSANVSVHTLVLPGWQWVIPAAAGEMFSLLAILWLINLYNFMDGMDGLAGGMGLIGFACLGGLGAQAGDWGFAAVCAAISAACAGFLLPNFAPARIFMGDAGASVLGLLVVAMSLKAHRDGLFSLWVSLLVFSPFVIDATVTLMRRLMAGEVIWKAHRSHFYQRIVGLGWSHRRTALFEYLLMCACATTALSLSDAHPGIQRTALLVWAAIYVTLMVAVTAVERRRDCS